ncbi:hypothetical protein [Rubellicoccus peritrichatus]|uniref:Uncharacterized protein n=1 Tax=Rubellicoccus peritrichatus TaxID=3080537 RepID=A0AAQ3L8Q4_9BACT|nr:hypothetical protein [Puniceicoccus sp. CR14]WOO41166.1 hypothetical protein RZN69_21305 [Puniceicoccus sp. CR14]
MKTETKETLVANEISAANESRFNSAHYSEPLTAFSAGWKDTENLEAMLDFIAPKIPVGRRFEFKRAKNAEAFFSEADDIRAIGGAFKRVEYAGETVNEKTLNKGLTMRIDHDETMTDDWQERAVQLLLQRLQRNELRRAISVLSAAADNENKSWNDISNPDGDIRAALIAAANESGVRPNRVLFGEGAWDLRAASYESQNNAGAYASAALTSDGLARKLLIEGVRITSARYQSAASAKSGIVGNAVYAFFGQDAYGKDEPSNLKRFVTPVDGGGSFRVYLEESSKYTDVTVEHYSNIVVTSQLGIRKLTVS